MTVRLIMGCRVLLTHMKPSCARVKRALGGRIQLVREVSTRVLCGIRYTFLQNAVLNKTLYLKKILLENTVLRC